MSNAKSGLPSGSQQGGRTFSRRWYDNRPDSSASVTLLINLPGEMQKIICKGVILLAEKECAADELFHQFRSLGAEKVMALYRSKQKKRGYDKTNVVHQMMNYLSILSDENRMFMIHHIISLKGMMSEYLRLCQRYLHTPESDELESLTQTYVHRGQGHVQILLQEFEVRFIAEVEQEGHKQHEYKKAQVQRELRDADTGSGMQIARFSKRRLQTPPASPDEG